MTRFRVATPADADALLHLERAANLASLGHVFPPERYPYPGAEVLARWRSTLDEPGVRVEVIGGADLRAVVAYDATTLRHLAVHPDDWGRGLARAAVGRAVAGMAATGAEHAVLWCLTANTRARGLYAHLGWRETGRRRAAQWPPHPEEREHDLDLRHLTPVSGTLSAGGPVSVSPPAEKPRRPARTTRAPGASDGVGLLSGQPPGEG